MAQILRQTADSVLFLFIITCLQEDPCFHYLFQYLYIPIQSVCEEAHPKHATHHNKATYGTGPHVIIIYDNRRNIFLFFLIRYCSYLWKSYCNIPLLHQYQHFIGCVGCAVCGDVGVCGSGCVCVSGWGVGGVGWGARFMGFVVGVGGWGGWVWASFGGVSMFAPDFDVYIQHYANKV